MYLAGFWKTMVRGSIKAGSVVGVPGTTNRAQKVVVRQQPTNALGSLTNTQLAIGGVSVLGLAAALLRK
jgi:hypothetical protein